MISLYIDPSAVTYVIPLIAGIAVAIGSWIYLHFHRAKTKVYKKLGIDENANKEVEDDIIVNDENADGNAASDNTDQNTENKE